jgi:predicted nuclease of predicted toxin-antitoxin system
MRILFDHGTPAPLRRKLVGHSVATAYEIGWADLDNGSLLDAAEAEFDILITTDQSLRHQQNLIGRKLSILVLSTTSWPKIEPQVQRLVTALNVLRPGELVLLQFS